MRVRKGHGRECCLMLHPFLLYVLPWYLCVGKHMRALLGPHQQHPSFPLAAS